MKHRVMVLKHSCRPTFVSTGYPNLRFEIMIEDDGPGRWNFIGKFKNFFVESKMTHEDA